MANESEVLYAEEVRKILHISKRKCAWMLQNGIIPCHDTGKKTHRYIVLKSDLDAFIQDSQENPEKYVFPVTFTAVKPKKREPDKYFLHPCQVPTGFRDWLDDEWYKLPDVFSPRRVETILGYSQKTVRCWINRGWLKIVIVRNVEIVPREWLIDFTCEYAFQIAKKSEKHRELLDRYFG